MIRKITNLIKELYAKLGKEAFRFILVGIFSTVLHYVIYVICNNFMSIDIAYSLGYAVSLVANYYLSSRFTFTAKRTFRNSIGFVLCHAINYGLHMVLLNWFIQLDMPKDLAPLPVYAIAIPVNFLLVRAVFRMKFFNNK